mgnify:CR=1 FL=1
MRRIKELRGLERELKALQPAALFFRVELTDDADNLLSFSVQYHPEAAAGPHDSAYLFDRFVDVMVRRRDGAGGRAEHHPTQSNTDQEN